MLAVASIGPCKWFAAFGITSKVSPRRGESTHLRPKSRRYAAVGLRNACFRASLHIGIRLANIFIHTADGFLQILVGVGEHQTEVALTHSAEGGAGHADDAGAPDQLLGELLRGLAEGLDVDEGVEAALGLGAGEAGDGVDAVHQNVTAAGVVRQHGLDAVGALESLGAGHLREAGHAGHQALLQRGELGHIGGVGHQQIAHAPAGHGIGLGEAVQHDDVITNVVQLGHREGLHAVIDDGVIGLVGEHPQVVLLHHLSDGQHVLLAHHRAGGVAGGVQDDGLCLGGDALLHVGGGHVEAHRSELEALGGVEEEVIDYKLGDIVLILSKYDSISNKWTLKPIVCSDAFAKDDLIRWSKEDNKQVLTNETI